jgi:two-component system, chemotaxis family, chemotaxis protein CheY
VDDMSAASTNFSGKILLVDDEPHIRTYLSLVVKQLGNPTIVEARDGEEGVIMFEQESPDLVLLDVNLPRMSGIEALKAIKAVNPHAVVIMLTSAVSRQTVEAALANGAANYIRKDAPKEKIAAEIAETIDAMFELE